MSSIGVPGVCDSGASVRKEHPQDVDPQSLTNSSNVPNRLEYENDYVILKAVNSDEQPLKQRSPRSLPLSSKDCLPDKQTREAANIKKLMDPNYAPWLERASSVDVSAVKFSPCSKQRSFDRDLKSPRLCLSPALPYTCKSQHNCVVVGSNQLHTSISEVQIDDCIGSRTRQRATAQTKSKTRSHSIVSSPVHYGDSSPTIRHKYPTRHKTTGQC